MVEFLPEAFAVYSAIEMPWLLILVRAWKIHNFQRELQIP
jgi:hypothetical protein